MKAQAETDDNTMTIYNSINLTFKENKNSIRVFAENSFEVAKIIKHIDGTFSHQTLGFKSPYMGTKEEAENSVKTRITQFVKQYSKEKKIKHINHGNKMF
jgi:hypothetical protein